jgi:hypothetical protein
MQPIADCKCCGKPLHEGDDFNFCPEGIVWVCRTCVEAEEDRLREGFGWLGAGKGEALADDDPSEFPGREVG